jgi:type VI secretion system protein VasG
LLEARLDEAESEMAALDALWTEQKTLAEHLLELRQQLAKAREAADAAAPSAEEDAEGSVIETSRSTKRKASKHWKRRSTQPTGA